MDRPYHTRREEDAEHYARVRAYAARKPAVVTIDLKAAAFVVYIGPHAEFLAGRFVLCTVSPHGEVRYA